MLRYRDRVEDFLVAMAGPWLPIAVLFTAKVLVGVLSLPIAVVGLTGLYAFRTVLFLHGLGEQTIVRSQISINRFIDPQQNS